MKANESPDFPEKVYIPRDPEYPQSPNIWWERESSESNIEYIRTDAFIENAVSYLNSKLYDWVQTTNPNQRSCANTVMKQDFIENFRKYMEDDKV